VYFAVLCRRQSNGMAVDFREPLAASDSARRSSMDQTELVVLLGAVSLFEFIAAVVTCSQQQTCGGLNAYAVAAGCISIAVCLLLVYFRDRAEASPMALFLLVWWVVACFFLTFISPFADFENGFVACWIAVVVSMNLYRTINTNFADAIGRASRDAGAARSVLWLLNLTSTGMWIEALVAMAHSTDDGADSSIEQSPSDAGADGGIKMWAMFVGQLSSLACTIAAICFERDSNKLGPLAVCLGVWWIQGVVISFIPGVFLTIFNGLAFTLISVMLSAFLVALCR